jgi:hypothetical protein
MYIMDPKDPNSTLPYTIDWSAWLGSDIIISSTWIVPTGITQVSSAMTSTTTTINLTGGTLNASYIITNRIYTVDGKIQDQSFKIYIHQL